MKKIVVASINPVKAEAVLNAFQRVFPEEQFTIDAIAVSTGVSDQPMSDGAARKGAVTRAQNGRQAAPGSDFWVGVEGGCDTLEEKLVAFAWIVVLSKEHQGSARTALFQLPHEVQTLVKSGFELGDADDLVFGKTNSKQKSGAVGLLTDNIITRTSLYEHAVILALIPFKNLDFYFV